MARRPQGVLRRGWTTGACAAAAARAAYQALLTGEFPDPVTIRLPKGETPSFPLAQKVLENDAASAAVIKDAGDDPDVTHGALIVARVSMGAVGSGVTFHGGSGVGTVTKPGLPVPPGEPAINPAPRVLIREMLTEVATEHDRVPDVAVVISVPDGKRMAAHTWNPRLGIVGGLSILGTTGVVIPYSCSAWIHSIHQGIDVARATGIEHIAGATGKTSEAAVRRHHGLEEAAVVDMGDFVGGMLKYLNNHPVPRLTIAGGFAKLTKLAQGHMDLHSDRSQVDFDALAALADGLGALEPVVRSVRVANTASEALELVAGLRLGDAIAAAARETVLGRLSASIELDVLVVNRQGRTVGHAGS
ncbi:MAG: cobalt-precorrin-5B (C(1))-methyltransferase [Pseudomonadota bacterium]|jgi:cobalt-precorrin-5B (C1)-methyltransferase|nr:cobalt-precorrin-5B (C(1))-methyltransferase [Pseudomonadota bacterium]